MPFGLHGSRPIIGSNVGSMSGDPPFNAKRVNRVPLRGLCPDLITR